MSKPVIGVVADVVRGGKHVVHSVQEKYLDAISGGAGGLVVMLPGWIDRPGGAFADDHDFAQILPMLDGLFLTGSISNIMPECYGRTLENPNSPADPARDHVALRLIREAVARKMPLFGVCRGFQEINVAMGGTLHQAVHSVAGFNDHRENHEADLSEQYAPVHDIAFSADGLLQRFTGMTAARVNSLHGQGVDQLAPTLRIDATAPDGLIEAFSSRDETHFLLGLQWHPEWHFRENPLSVKILDGFGDAARVYRANK